MSSNIKIIGLNEFRQYLSKLDEKTKDKVIRETAKKALIPMREDAKRQAGKHTGNLQKSIGFWVNKHGVWMGPRTSGNFKGYHAHLVEEGTKERKLRKPRLIGFEKGGKKWVAMVKSTGKMPARPFMEPAYQQNKNKVMNTFFNEIERAVNGG